MKKRSEAILITLILLVGILIVNAFVNRSTLAWDLTEDKRYSLSDSTEEVINSIEDPVYVRVLLSGTFPAGFERLEEATRSLLQQYRSINSDVNFEFEDPTDGSIEELKSRYENLKEIGVLPTNLVVQDNGQMTERLIFPYALISSGKRKTVVNLLKAQGAGESEDMTLNKSISLLEYKFADQLYKLTRAEKPNIVLLEGRGELPPQQTAVLEQTLQTNYDIGRISLDSIYSLSTEIDLLIVARPSHLFFDYGVRYKANLLLDLQCSKVPQVVAMQGGKPQTEMFPWFYHPIITGSSNHPTTNNVSDINLTFPSEIEILEREGITSEVVLATSPSTFYQVYPMSLSFDVVRLGEDPSKFNRGNKAVAVLSEGQFDSHFKNRLNQEQQETLKQLGTPFKAKSVGSKQLWISDAYLISNLYNPANNRISPIGFNQWEQKLYSGNQEYILNSIDYMVDEINVMEARNKDVKLRLLNRAKVINEKTQWQVINMVLPLLLLTIFGLIFNYLRRRKYAK